MTRDYRGYHFFVRENGKLYATPLLAALVVVETSDSPFALDAVPAVLAIASSTFVAYSSNAFAVLSLRVLYFALKGLIDRFVYLHYGLAAILTFFGAKLLLQGFGVHVPIAVSLLVILVGITASIGAPSSPPAAGRPAKVTASPKSARTARLPELRGAGPTFRKQS